MEIKYQNNPTEIFTKVPNGNYEVTVTIKADEPITLDIIAQSRRFYAKDITMRRGEIRDFTFIVNVGDYHKENESKTHVFGVTISIVCDGSFTAASMVSPIDVPTIYIAGDSTVTDQPAEYPYCPTSTYCGWGQMFPMLLDEKIAVANYAQSGSTTEAFKNCNFIPFKDKIKAGDYLVVEFGHNDQKIETLAANTGYRKNLQYYIDFAKEHGATPILCSPMNRIIFQEDGTLLNLLGEYRKVVKQTAEENQVPFIDLWSRTTEYFEIVGSSHAWNYFWGNGVDRDYTHTNDIGGFLVARMFAQEAKRANLPFAAFLKEDVISIEPPKKGDGVNPDNRKEFEHLKTIGLVNTPTGAIDDIDKDITGI